MFTLIFEPKIGKPIYQQLYIYIKNLITDGNLKSGDRLPSKRKLAAHLQVSNSTVENAYAQLVAEGYITAKEKYGYYVRFLDVVRAKQYKIKAVAKNEITKETGLFDLKTNAVDTEKFPFSVWTKLLRESLSEDKYSLLQPSHPQGDQSLRIEIARYLKNFRSMDVNAGQIVLGAGMEYLLGLITELLPEQSFALENPCYQKLPKILQSKKVPFYPIPLDDEGLSIENLYKSDASIAFITPSRHFPLGTVTSVSRRMQLLKWAAQDEKRYLIEDDYDSEYRYQLKPIPPLHSLDSKGKVIYLNTFARTLAPSLRIGYMVLPEKLLKRYQKTLLLYSCTVSRFDQATLQRFLQNDYYERHLNRMRLVYRNKRDILLSGLAAVHRDFLIKAGEAGLHVIVTSKKGLTEKNMIDKILAKGVRVYKLSDYYLGQTDETHSFVVGYGGINNDDLKKATGLIAEALQGI